ncbi:MAG: aminopeptidase N [Oceanococcus sp.]
MKKKQYLKDYRPSVWQVPRVELRFDIVEQQVLVHARMWFEGDPSQPLVLDGRQMELLSLAIDGEELSAEQYSRGELSLSLQPSQAQFVLESTVRLKPWENTSLEGLYHAGGILCTQCESHGFSRITYALDRPDVMSVYTVEITADATQWPILLANGEQQSRETLEDGRQRVIWHDPHPKPCYLFAVVAGDMAMKTRPFTTSEGREVDIAFYCDHGIEDRMEHAIDSLVRSMQWDEKVYGLAYDLNTYNVVVAGAFNMGAMENKGLNIFNPKYVLASPETATDADFAAVEAVIGHEYFHNWTGNRVTCRDWFQLSLKEGLTVFRDQQFSADCGAGPVQRLQQVKMLRARQFAEDAGPLSHPVRPESYVEMNNFYTMTVYEKGAELVRLLHARLGVDGFRKGMDLYFERHDGQAVTIEDFLAAHADANKLDLQGIQQWYGQAGTPLVNIRDEYSDGRYTLHCQQSYPTNPAATPVLIPIKLSLLGAGGEQLVGSQVLEFDQAEQSFHFDVASQPVPVLFEGFSAPVNWDYAYSQAALALIAAHSSDPFSRWEASQRIYQYWVQKAYSGENVPSAILEPFAHMLTEQGDEAVIAALLSPPSVEDLMLKYTACDPLALAQAVQRLEVALAEFLQDQLPAAYAKLNQGLAANAYRFEPKAAAQRSLRARVLKLWVDSGSQQACDAAETLYQNADNLSDRMAALQALNQTDSAMREALLLAFYQCYKDDKLVLDRWFALQASRHGTAGLNAVRELLQHAAFDTSNPNRVRAVLGSFGMANPSALYAADGIELLAQQILVYDKKNPQLASRLITPFAGCQGLAAKYRVAVERAISLILDQAQSPDVREQAQRIAA